MRDLLIRYLLGELDYDEQRQLESQLRQSPELRRDLAHLQACFKSAEVDDFGGAEPPSGLAQRTADRVCDFACSCGASEDQLPLAWHAPAAAEPASAAPRWSLADVTVAAGVCLAMSMLLVPALRDSRDAARRVDCQNNLSQMGMFLANYAETHGGQFPHVGPDENAGIYVRRLIDAGLASPEEIAELRVCSGSPEAETLRAGHGDWRVPTLSEFETMTPHEQALAKKRMSWSYAYRFPFVVGNRYYYVIDRRDPYEPMLADAPSPRTDDFTSSNHGDIVQVLFQDGSVRMLRRCTVPDHDDHLFKNNNGVPAAGLGRQDVVLGRSEATPAPIQFIGRPRSDQGRSRSDRW